MEKNLTLWDIDGNLINVYKHHTPAYQKAIESVYGVKPSFGEIEKNYGLPARDVVSIPVRKFGIEESDIQERIEDVFGVYSGQLEKNIRTSSDNAILPGVFNLLAKIRSLNIPMGIVTGNIKKAGEAIIRGSDLHGFFDSGISSYGDNATYRHEIVLEAISNARRLGLADKNTNIYVFGDTPADVEAAKKNNCVSVAVVKNSNEPSSSPGGKDYFERKKILEDANPDFLFDDYKNLERVLSVFN